MFSQKLKRALKLKLPKPAKQPDAEGGVDSTEASADKK